MANNIYCQLDSTKVYIQDLYENWQSTYSDYTGESGIGKPNEVNLLFSNNFTDSLKIDNYIADLKHKEAEYYRKDYGIGLNAGFLHNPSGGEQDFDNIIYRSRFITDVGWDILRSGYVHNRLRAQIAENEKNIALIENKEIRKNAGFAILWNYVIYQFNLQKIKVLDDRMSLAEDKIEAVKKLYFLNKVDETELLKHLESIAEIRSMYRVYQDFNHQLEEEYKFENTDSLKLPLIDIKYNEIERFLSGKKEDSIVFYEKENIDLKNKFINEISLRTSLRYSYYDLVTANPSSRDFVSLGVSLGIPLNFNHKVKKEWIDLQKESVEYIPEKEKIGLQKSILTNYYEFRYKLKQFTAMHYKRLLYNELLRKENARYSIDYLSFNPVSSLRVLDDLMKIDIEMLDLKQQMYLKLISIHADMRFTKVEDLYTIHELDRELEKINSSERSVYIWDDIFNQKKNTFLLRYIEKEKFNKVIISYNKSQENNQSKSNFIDSLKSQGLEIEIMTGKNSLLGQDPTGYYNLITQSLDLAKINSLHLDVEPHTFEDWKVKKNNYLDQYIELLDKTRLYCNDKGLKLSVSIPLHYPEVYLKKIYERADHVYFMAYENIDTEYIVRKVKDFEREKTIISLRTEDFSNLLELEMKIIDIQTKYQPLEFTIHDLRRMIEMEKQ